MALTASLTKGTVSADGTTTVWNDSTVYGGANPLRTQVAVFLTAKKLNEDLQETSLVVTTFDPELATSFTVTNTDDGWQKLNFVIINNWDGATTYDQYDLVWDTGQNKFYEYINTTPTSGNVVTNTTYWTVVTDPTTKIANVGTAQEADNLVYQVVQNIDDHNTAKCFGNVMIKYSKEYCAPDLDSCDSNTEKWKKRIHTLLTDMRVANTRQLYLEGERAARAASVYCKECGCD